MSLTTTFRGLAVCALFATTTFATAAESKVDPALADYKPVQGVSGSIVSVGSDTMNNMMALWAEGFKKIYPNVKIEIIGKGSGTAIPALVDGTSIFGPMSRPAKDKEADAFESKFGYKPVQLPTSIDMLAVFVHRDNPIKGLDLTQVDAIFSSTRNGGAKEDISRWGQAGLDGAWENLPISLYGRNSVSGTYSYFKKHACFKGDYKDTVKEQSGSAAVVNGVANDKGGIGYSGIGYKTADVRALPLAGKPGEDFVAPTVDTVKDYPLSRYLLLTVNKKPGEKLDTLRAEFLKYVFSKQGQEAVVRDGYLPLNAKIAEKALGMVDLK